MSHPDPRFRGRDDEAALDHVERIGLAHLFVAGMVVHVPLVRHGARALRFHVARGNRVHGALNGARVLVSVTDPHGYVTPSWYGDATDQVPTWNYVAVEIEGVVRTLDEAELLDQMDRLAALHEPRASDRPWTRAKMGAAAQARMLRAITGFEIAVGTVRATAKLSQNRSPADRGAVAAGLRMTGRVDLAAAMERTS